MRTADELRQYAEQVGVEVETSYFEDFYRFSSPGTRNAERLLAEESVYSNGEGLYKIEASGIYEETEAVALEILHLVRDKGYRFRDIAVISNDIEKYRSAINTYFDIDGVPFFCNFASNILYTPVIVFAKNCIGLLGSFDTDNILEMMKSPLLGIESADTGLVEAYCEVWAPGKNDWLKPFEKNPMGFSAFMGEKETEDLKTIEKTRKAVIPKLVDFVETYRGKTVNEQMIGIIELLKSFIMKRSRCRQALMCGFASDGFPYWSHRVSSIFCVPLWQTFPTGSSKRRSSISWIRDYAHTCANGRTRRCWEKVS